MSRCVALVEVCKAYAPLLPALGAVLLVVARVVYALVVVDNNLYPLCATLAWQEYVGTCPLEHRYKEWEHVALGV